MRHGIVPEPMSPVERKEHMTCNACDSGIGHNAPVNPMDSSTRRFPQADNAVLRFEGPAGGAQAADAIETAHALLMLRAGWSIGERYQLTETIYAVRIE